MSQVAKLFRRFISSISVGPPIFPKINGDKVFYNQGRKHFHLLAGEALSTKLSTGEASGAHLTGALV